MPFVADGEEHGPCLVYYHTPLTLAEKAEFPAGWYWVAGFPGRLPDGEPSGPFETKAEAVKDANNGA